MSEAIEKILKEVALWALALFLLGCLTTDYDKGEEDWAKLKAKVSEWRGAE